MAVSESVVCRGLLEGHENWVTCVAVSPVHQDTVVSGSRDKSLIIWKLTRDEEKWGVPVKRLTGHSHFVEDLVISSDGQFALSGSWDSTLRLWDLTTGTTRTRFVGHKKDVLSVAFSSDNRQILSGSRDRTVKLWNTIGECKFTLEAHSDWVTCVKFLPANKPMGVTTAWDKALRVWDLSFCKNTNTITPPEEESQSSFLNALAVSPDGTIAATGGKDGVARLWHLGRSELVHRLDLGSVIYQLAFSPIRFWICCATQDGIRVWDLATRSMVAELGQDHEGFQKKEENPACLSVAWSADGRSLYAGYTDKTIRVWEFPLNAE